MPEATAEGLVLQHSIITLNMKSIERNGRNFGGATLIGDHADDYGFFDKDIRGKSLDMGWSHACVIAAELTNPNHPTLGPDLMLKRYGETNFWFGYILAESAKFNPQIFANLNQSIPRKEGEPVGIFEVTSVPLAHLTKMFPMSRIYGYALPRVHIEAMGRGEARNQERALRAIQALDEAVGESSSPAELLAVLSEKSLEFGADAKKILSHILPSGVLNEENCLTDYQEIAEQLKLKAPTIWKVYASMTTQEKESVGVAEFDEK